jgi:hypothetical protein
LLSQRSVVVSRHAISLRCNRPDATYRWICTGWNSVAVVASVKMPARDCRLHGVRHRI